jgi:hypothetical protein
LTKRRDLDYLSAKGGYPPPSGVGPAHIKHPVCGESDGGSYVIGPPYAGEAPSGNHLCLREPRVSQKIYKEMRAGFAAFSVDRDTGLAKERLQPRKVPVTMGFKITLDVPERSIHGASLDAVSVLGGRGRRLAGSPG